MASTLNRTNRILLGLVLLLSVLLWGPGALEQGPLAEWLNRKTQSATTDSLTRLKPADITAIALSAANRPAINLIKADHQWWLMTPHKQLANPSKVATLLKLLESPIYTRFELTTGLTTDDPSANDSFIVNRTSVSVAFNDLTIGFGQRHPVGQRRYLILGNETALVDDYYFHHVAGPWQNWVAVDAE